MNIKDLKEYAKNESEIRKYGLDCYEENCYIDDDWIDYLNENGEGVYSLTSGTRGEISIEKVTDKEVLNNLPIMDDDEYEIAVENGSEIWVDYFYYKKST